MIKTRNTVKKILKDSQIVLATSDISREELLRRSKAFIDEARCQSASFSRIERLRKDIKSKLPSEE